MHCGQSRPSLPKCLLLHAVAKMILAAPKVAAKRASEATKSQRPAAEAAIVAAVQDCLHFAGALRPIMAVLSPAAALDVAEQLLGLFALAQPLLSQHAAGCLLQLVQAAPNTRSLTAAQVHMLLKVRTRYSPPCACRQLFGSSARSDMV